MDIVWDIDAIRYTSGRNNPFSCDIVSLKFDAEGNYSDIKSKGNIEQIIRYSGRILSKGNNSFTIRKTYANEETYISENFISANVFVNDLVYNFEVTGVSSVSSDSIIIYCI